MKRILKWIGLAAIAVFAILLLLAAAGAIYEFAGARADTREFPPRGRLMQAGPIKLHLDCVGQGRPTVILESGAGVPAAGWYKVQPEVAKFARVCSYDRAGYGWSDPSPNPRTSENAAKELKALLDAAGEAGPYVMVGHSLGGFNVRVFTAHHPAEVVGVVLVDASHPDQVERMEGLLPPDIRAEEKSNDDRDKTINRVVVPVIIHLGLQRLSLARGWTDVPPYVTRDKMREFAFLNSQAKARAAFFDEEERFAESAAQVRSAGSLGDRPLVVLTAMKDDEPDPLLSKEQQQAQRKLWIDVLQAEQLRLSTHGVQIKVEDSGHMIPFEKPDAVVAAIRQVWASVAQTALPH